MMPLEANRNTECATPLCESGAILYLYSSFSAVMLDVASRSIWHVHQLTRRNT
jgi:hypothetical protein